MTGWTLVTRSTKQIRRTVSMEVSLEDRVQKILNTVSGSDCDVYVTCEGRILRNGDKMKSCGVRDGTTVQVTSRMRGGGEHKDKKNNAEKKRSASPVESEARKGKKEVDSELNEDGQEVRSGATSSSSEEQFEALDKEMMIEKYRKDLESGGLDVLVGMDAKQAEELLMKFRETLTGIPEDQRTMAVWSLTWMAEKKK